MPRSIFLGCLLVASAGCQGPVANFAPFATYGPTQVPPPPTGSIGRTDPYYQRSANNPWSVDAASPRVSSTSRFTSDNDAPQVARMPAEQLTPSARTSDRRLDWNQAASYNSQLGWRAPTQSYESVAPLNGSRPRPRFR